MDSQSSIPALDRNRNPLNTQKEDDAAQLAEKVEHLQAFMTATPDFPMGDDYLAGIFPALYRMRQAHQRITAFTNTIARSTIENHKIRGMLAYILRVEVGSQEDDEAPPRGRGRSRRTSISRIRPRSPSGQLGTRTRRATIIRGRSSAEPG